MFLHLAPQLDRGSFWGHVSRKLRPDRETPFSHLRFLQPFGRIKGCLEGRFGTRGMLEMVHKPTCPDEHSLGAVLEQKRKMIRKFYLRMKSLGHQQKCKQFVMVIDLIFFCYFCFEKTKCVTNIYLQSHTFYSKSGLDLTWVDWLFDLKLLAATCPPQA